MWPASAQFRQQLLGDGHENDGAPLAPPAPSLQNEVFVGALPDGQLYALPRSTFTTFDFVQAPDTTAGPLALPYRDPSAVSVATEASREIVAVHEADGIPASDSVVTKRWLEHCSALWEGARARRRRRHGDDGAALPSLDYQCLIGVQNVTATYDSAVSRSALPPGMQQLQDAAIDGGWSADKNSAPSPDSRIVPSWILPLWLIAMRVVWVLGVPESFQVYAAVAVASAAFVLAVALIWSSVACGSRRPSIAFCRRFFRGRTNRRGRGGRGGGTVTTAVDTPAGQPAPRALSQAPPQPPAAPSSEALTVWRGGEEYRVIGRLAVSKAVLGTGCHGTIVFAGEVR